MRIEQWLQLLADRENGLSVDRDDFGTYLRYEPYDEKIYLDRLAAMVLDWMK